MSAVSSFKFRVSSQISYSRLETRLKLLKCCAINGSKSHPVARLQASRRRGLGIEHAQRRPSNQSPPSGRVNRIDARLAAGNSHAATSNRRSRSRQPWCVQSFRQPAEINKPWRESEEVHEIRWRRMQPNHFFY